LDRLALVLQEFDEPRNRCLKLIPVFIDQLLHERRDPEPHAHILVSQHVGDKPVDRRILFEEGDDVVGKALPIKSMSISCISWSFMWWSRRSELITIICPDHDVRSAGSIHVFGHGNAKRGRSADLVSAADAAEHGGIVNRMYTAFGEG
jgi:hypothetical protein